jgi:hypothetical protein
VQDADLFAFMAIFRDLLQMFPKRLDESDITQLSKAYFAALRRFSVSQIQAGADAWVQHGKFFPKPAEWREHIPRELSAAVSIAPLTPVEAAEYLDAERKHWEDVPCGCRECREAGVSHRMLRNVPEQDEHGVNIQALLGERHVVRCRWIHGHELARWYAAKERFWSEYIALIKRLTMPSVGPIAEPEVFEEVECEA